MCSQYVHPLGVLSWRGSIQFIQVRSILFCLFPVWHRKMYIVGVLRCLWLSLQKSSVLLSLYIQGRNIYWRFIFRSQSRCYIWTATIWSSAWWEAAVSVFAQTWLHYKTCRQMAPGHGNTGTHTHLPGLHVSPWVLEWSPGLLWPHGVLSGMVAISLMLGITLVSVKLTCEYSNGCMRVHVW